MEAGVKVVLEDGTMAVSELQARMLRERGIRTRAEANAFLDAHSELMICDFCSESPVALSYETDSFDTGSREPDGRAHWSVGAWAACATCATLIDRGDKLALTARSVSVFLGKNPSFVSDRQAITEQLQVLHAEFWARKKGVNLSVDRLAVVDGMHRITS